MIGQRIKSTIRHIVASIYHFTGYSLAQLEGRVIILMYHRVVTEKELMHNYIQPGMYVRNDVFEMQIKFLMKYFQILSFQELLDLWKEGKWDKRKRHCVITFDDGWLDNYQYAYPVLKKNNIPATIFLPTDLIETNEWFWPEKMIFILRHFYERNVTQEQVLSMKSILEKNPLLANNNGRFLEDKIDLAIEICKALPDDEVQRFIADMMAAARMKLPEERLLMNWPEIKEMSQYGMSFGSHACSHKILTRLSDHEVKKEIEGSIAALRARSVNHVPVFCYPNGNYTREIAGRLKSAGYEAAVSTVLGIEDCTPSSLFSLKRIGIHNDISKTVPLLSYRLSGI